MQLEFSNPMNPKRDSGKLTKSPSGGHRGHPLPSRENIAHRPLSGGIRGWHSFTLPTVITLIALYCSISFLYPLFIEQFAKSRAIVSLFREKENQSVIQQKIDIFKSQTAKLSQLINTLDSSSQRTGAIIDQLYENAGIAKFKLLKVETGSPVIIERLSETPYIIQGNGSYASIGVFIQQIENSKQSTRVRQIVMNNAENGQLETLIEFVVIGE